MDKLIKKLDKKNLTLKDYFLGNNPEKHKDYNFLFKNKLEKSKKRLYR